MSTDSPKVSIGVPVYNGEAFLRRTLDCLLVQTFEDFEIIVSDNASTDGTEAICRDYVKRDSRIRYDRLPNNLGANRNFNRLVALSRGAYFKWAAADDYCRPEFLAAMVRVLDEKPDVVWCHSQSGKIDSYDRVLQIDDPDAEGLSHTTQAGLPRRHYDSPDVYRRYAGVILGPSWCADCFGLIRRCALDQTQLFPACYGSEKVLLGQLALIGKYHEVPETLFYQRIHSGASAKIVSRAGQSSYANGMQSGRRLGSMRWAILRSHCQVVGRSSLSTLDRLRCYGAIVQYLGQFHKWGHVLRSAWSGRPIKEFPNDLARTLQVDSNAALSRQTDGKR